MAIRFLSGQTIDGTLSVTGNVQAATFNTLPIETARNNNANRIVRTNVHGYVDFGWINTTSGNHTGSITRITASNDAYLRYVTPAQFRTGVTDGFYAPASTVSGVTSVATGNGLTGGTITSTGTLTMSGSYSGDFTIGGTTGSGGNALSVNRGSDGSQAMRIQNSGEVVIPSNYLYCNAGGTSLYVQNSAVFRGAILNDGSNAPVRIADDLTITENLQVTGAMYQDVSSIGGYIVKPKGADFFTASPTQTGAIEIRFPTGGATRNDMVFFTVDVYQYTTNRSFSVKAGGYIYQGIGSNTWVNVFAQVYAKNSNQNYTIRFGDNGSTHCMWIGESTDSWSYSQVVVRDFFGGYATDIDDYKTGWDITFDSLTGKTINNTLTNNFPLAQDIISGAYLPLSGGTMSGNIQMLSNSLQFDQTGTRSWNISPGSGNLNITSGDSVGSVSLNCGLIVADTLTANSRIIIQSRNDNTNVGTINSTNNQSDWQNLVASSGQFTVTQYNAIQNYTNSPTGVYTYGSVFSTRTANHSFQLYSSHTGDLCYKTQWNNDNYSGWRGIPVYGANSGSPSVKDLYSTRVYDADNTAYFMDPHSTSQVNTIEWVNSTNNGRIFANTWGLKIQTDSGYLHFGPANTSHAHIYTDRPNVYFDKPITVNGASVINTNDIRAGIFYDVNNTAYYTDPASTSNLNTLTLAGSLTVQSGSGTINGKATQLFEHGYGSDSGTFYQTSGSFAGYSGWANYWIGNHGDGSTYYNTVDIRPFWGPPKYSRLEGGTFRGPYNYVTNENDQTIGVYLQSTTSLRAPIFYDYNNTAFYLDPSTTGTSVNVAGDVVAYASSDIRFKNNITPITNALDKLSKIGGYTFEWNEISHKETGKKDIGVVAQEVEEILPEIVQTRSNGYKAVDYQKLTALLIESVKEQQVIINDLKSRIETLENN